MEKGVIIMGIWKELTRKRETVGYIGGFPNVKYFDHNRETIDIYQHDKKGKLILQYGFASDLTCTVLDIQWYENITSERNVGKAAVGAITGGVIAGPIGMVVGGALGAKKKRKDQSHAVLRIRFNNREWDVHIYCTLVQFKRIQSFYL
jgi:hypothetical protein